MTTTQASTQAMDQDPLEEVVAVQQQWETRSEGAQRPENTYDGKAGAKVDVSSSQQPNKESGEVGTSDVTMGDQSESSTQAARGTFKEGSEASSWAHVQEEKREGDNT